MARFSTLFAMMLMAAAALADQEACAGDQESCIVGNSMLVSKAEAHPSAAPVREHHSVQQPAQPAPQSRAKMAQARRAREAKKAELAKKAQAQRVQLQHQPGKGAFVGTARNLPTMPPAEEGETATPEEESEEAARLAAEAALDRELGEAAEGVLGSDNFGATKVEHEEEGVHAIEAVPVIDQAHISPDKLREFSADQKEAQALDHELARSMVETERTANVNHGKAVIEGMEAQEAENAEFGAADGAEDAAREALHAAHTREVANEDVEMANDAKSEFEKKAKAEADGMVQLSTEKKHERKLTVAWETKFALAEKFAEIATKREQEMSDAEDASKAKNDEVRMAQKKMAALEEKLTAAQVNLQEKDSAVNFHTLKLEEASQATFEAQEDEIKKAEFLGQKKAEVAKLAQKEAESIQNAASALKEYESKQKAAHKLEEKSTERSARAQARVSESVELASAAKAEADAANAMPPVVEEKKEEAAPAPAA